MIVKMRFAPAKGLRHTEGSNTSGNANPGHGSSCVRPLCTCAEHDGIKSYYAVLALRCLDLHGLPQAGALFNYPIWRQQSKHKRYGERCPSQKLKKIFSHFFPSQCSLVSEGSSRRIFPKSLANPIQPGLARRREGPRDGAPSANVEPTAWS